MRRFLAFMVAVALLGLAVGLLLRRGATSATPTLGPKEAEPAAHTAPASLDAAGKEAASRSAVASDATAAAAGTQKPDPASATTLIVHVLSKENGAPLARVRVMVRAAASDTDSFENVEDTRGDVTHVPITDVAGLVEIVVPPDEALIAVASSEDKGCGMTALQVHALSAHEQREIDLHVPCGEGLRFFGRIVAGDTPIVGATVRMMRMRNSVILVDGIPPKCDPDTLVEVRSDAQGAFDLPLAPWTQPYLSIDAAGYGSIFALLQPGHESPERAQVLSMSREGVLRAFVLDAAEKPIANTTLVLKARGYDLEKGGDEQQPGTWTPLPDKEWKARLDDHGGCAINRLPAHVSLAVEVLKDGKLIGRIGTPLEFEPNQVLERTWKIGAGARIEGHVVDQYRTPVGNHEIWLFRKTSDGEGYADALGGRSAIAKATSDARGAFVLEDIDVGKWWIAAAPATDARTVPGPDDVSSWTQTVEVTGPETVTVTLTVHRGLLVSGHVLDPAGKPVADTFVTCTQRGEWYPGQTHTNDEGAFVVGPLGLGTCTLWAGGHDGLADSEHVTAEIGQTDVVLRLRAGGWISGKVVDAVTGDPCGATVHVVPEAGHVNPMSSEMETETEANGHFMIEGLEPDHYDLSFATTDGKFAVASNIVVTGGQVTGDVVVKVLPGGVISIQNEAKVPGASFRISSGTTPLTFERGIEVDMRSSVSVPAGMITVDYWTVDEKGVRSAHTRTVDIPVGETREVVLRDDG
jgi:uncharacterized GH25 family protein